MLLILRHMRSVVDERTKAWALFVRHNPPVLPALVAAALAGPPAACKPLLGLVRCALEKVHHMLGETASDRGGLHAVSADEDLVAWVFPSHEGAGKLLTRLIT